MSVLYAFAAARHGRVCNTCNKSEEYVGYSTKFGDAAGDFSPLGNYTVSEILLIGQLLDIPGHLIFKTPSDGMCGSSDEDNLGFTYLELDNYILNGKTPAYETFKRIQNYHKRNLHKVRSMPTCTPLGNNYWF
jgi:NAD+ synthase